MQVRQSEQSHPKSPTLLEYWSGRDASWGVYGLVMAMTVVGGCLVVCLALHCWVLRFNKTVAVPLWLATTLLVPVSAASALAFLHLPVVARRGVRWYVLWGANVTALVVCPAFALVDTGAIVTLGIAFAPSLAAVLFVRKHGVRTLSRLIPASPTKAAGATTAGAFQRGVATDRILFLKLSVAAAACVVIVFTVLRWAIIYIVVQSSFGSTWADM